jgi:hypothetical protein
MNIQTKWADPKDMPLGNGKSAGMWLTVIEQFKAHPEQSCMVVVMGRKPNGGDATGLVSVAKHHGLNLTVNRRGQELWVVRA